MVRGCGHAARHVHGTRAAYLADRCRCAACRGANAARMRAQRRATAYGTVSAGLVPADTVRAHLAALGAAGMGRGRIAAASGVSRHTVDLVACGHQARVRPATAAALLAVRADLAGAARMDATGAVRRVRALAATGWSSSAQADAAGLGVGVVRRLLTGPARVERATVDAVARAYDRLWDAAPPTGDRWERTIATRARNRAARAGWAPPAAWDDDAIDDPAASSAVGPSAPGGAQEPAACAVCEDVAWLVATGAGADEAAARLGRTVAALVVHLRRHSAPVPPGWYGVPVAGRRPGHRHADRKADRKQAAA